MRDAQDAGILALAQTLKTRIAQLRLPASSDFSCTVSIGIAPASKAESIHHWLRHADDALYQVKRDGRNGVRLWQPA